MTCRHDMSPATRKKVIAINVAVSVLKLTEMVLMITEKRRIARKRAELEAKFADSIAAAEGKLIRVQ